MDLDKTDNIDSVTITREILENVLSTHSVDHLICRVCGGVPTTWPHKPKEECLSCERPDEHHKYEPVMDSIWEELTLASL